MGYLFNVCEHGSVESHKWSAGHQVIFLLIRGLFFSHMCCKGATAIHLCLWWCKKCASVLEWNEGKCSWLYHWSSSKLGYLLVLVSFVIVYCQKRKRLWKIFYIIAKFCSYMLNISLTLNLLPGIYVYNLIPVLRTFNAYVFLQGAVADGGSTAVLTALQSLLTGLQQIECHESVKDLLVNNIMIGR